MISPAAPDLQHTQQCVNSTKTFGTCIVNLLTAEPKTLLGSLTLPLVFFTLRLHTFSISQVFFTEKISTFFDATRQLITSQVVVSEINFENMFLLQASLRLQISCKLLEMSLFMLPSHASLYLLEVIHFEKTSARTCFSILIRENNHDHFSLLHLKTFTEPATSYISATLSSFNFRACPHSDLCKKLRLILHQSSPYTRDQNTFDFFSSKANINLYLLLLKTLMIQDSLLKIAPPRNCFSLSDSALMSLHFTFSCTHSTWFSFPSCYHTKPE